MPLPYEGEPASGGVAPSFPAEADAPRRTKNKRRFAFFRPSFAPPPPIGRFTALALSVIIAVYALLAFAYLGTFQIPDTFLTTEKDHETFVLKLDKEAVLGQIYIYKWWGTSNIKVYASESPGGPWIVMGEDKLKQHMQWIHFALGLEEEKRYVKLEIEKPDIEVAEVVLLERATGSALAYTPVASDPEAQARLSVLNDEQETIDRTSTSMTFAFFDEFLYNTTAYGFLHDGDLHEITHPPLGKDIMALGILLFGMNSVGWRFMGALCGVLMLPALFFLARRVLRSNLWALAATLLLAVDFMHFTQTRMATIDSYPLLFMMLSYLFLHRYFTSDRPRGEALALLASGVFFGLSCASKWIGVYSGLGLAIMFAYFFICKLIRRREELGFSKNKAYTLKTALLCVLFFIVIPIGIYTAAYIPFMNLSDPKYHGLKGMFDNQGYMLRFHEGVNDKFSFASAWWSWPLVLTPINLFNSNVSNGTGARVVTMGNLLIWWSSVPAIVWATVLWFRRTAVAGPWFSHLRNAAGRARNRLRHTPADAAFADGPLALASAPALPAGETGDGLSSLSFTPLDFRDELSFLPPAPTPGIRRPDAGIMLIIVAYLCQYVPWMFITRPLFIYHYFSPVTFAIIAIAFVLKHLSQCRRKGFVVAVVFLFLSTLLFVIFYPILSGVYVQSWYFNAIRWMPWPF